MFKDIDDAIKHERKMAKEYKETADNWYAGGCSFAQAEGNVCLEFAKEHEQVIKWLEELKARREADRWIPVSERLPESRDWYLGTFKEPDTGWINPIPFICDYVGEITKGTTNEGWILRNCTDVDNASDYFRNLMCVAWKPLPKPYESEAEV